MGKNLRSNALRSANFTAAVLAIMGSASLAIAQTPPNQLERAARLQELQQLELDSRYHVNENVPPEQRAVVDGGGYFTFNYLSLDDQNDANHGLRQYDFVAYGRVLLDNANDFFIRFRTSYRDYNPGDSFDGLGSRVIDPDVDRAYYRFDLAAADAAYHDKRIDTDIAIKGGRDLAYWANGLVLTETLDGIVVDVTNPAFTIETLAGVTPTRTVDFDVSRPDFDHNTRRGFFGSMLSVPLGQQTPFVYGLIQRDYNGKNHSDLDTISTDFSYNSYYLGTGATGSLSDRLRYGVEAAYEFGNTLSNSFTIGNGELVQVAQTRNNIRAYGIDARLDYLVQDAHQSRLSLETIFASGDPDRGSTNVTFNGNRPGTDDLAFNSFGLINTGLAFAPAVSNLMALRVGASTFPITGAGLFSRLQVGTDFFAFWKLRENAPIDEPTTTGERYLGVEPDLYVNWQLVSDVTLALRYGAFIPNSSAFPHNDTRQFIYGGLTFAF
jgi:Alginate export